MKKYILLNVVLLGLIIGCKNQKSEDSKPKDIIQKTTDKSNLDSEKFKAVVANDSVRLYHLSNVNGMEVTFSNFGQRLVSLHVPDKHGKFDDIVLGYGTIDAYVNGPQSYYGAVIGRYGNRIANGTFSIGKNKYNLAKNLGDNNLHGGNMGFQNVVWNVDNVTSNSIVFSRISPDMEEGFPGNLEVTVSYVLTNDNELKIQYKATTDKSTVVNLTHHSFFNLKGEGVGDINDHLLTINANLYTPVATGLIPTGELAPVKDTPFDFTMSKLIGKDVDVDFEQLNIAKGYDHNFVLNNAPKNSEGLVFAAKVVEPQSGRTLEVFTDEPGIQFYGGNFLDGTDIGKSGKPYLFRGSFCLETQHYPNSPNQPNFPSTLLNPGEIYTSNCTYKFGVVED